MTEPLFEATVLPGRAVCAAGRLYVEGETVTLPESEADALEIAGFVRMASRLVETEKPKLSRRRSA